MSGRGGRGGRGGGRGGRGGGRGREGRGSSSSRLYQYRASGGGGGGNFAEKPESEILKEILQPETDVAPGGDDSLFCSLSDLRTFRAWDFSWPTLTKPRRFTGRHNYASDEAFFNTIQNHNQGVSHGLLKDVGAFDDNNSIVLYGGALVDIVTQRETAIKDWDLRLVGEEYVDSPEACVQAAKQFVANVFGWIRNENERIQIRNQKKRTESNSNNQAGEEAVFDVQKVITSRSKSTLTMVVPGRSVGGTAPSIGQTVLQFTFAPYKTVHDLLEHSTPHCTRLAVKNNAVVLDQRAKYCLESLCVVLDENSLAHCDFSTTGKKKEKPARSFSTEMLRVCTYFEDKGFDLILPSLDMKKLPVRNLKFDLPEVLDLPELTVIYTSLEENKIMVDRLGPAYKTNAPEEFGYDGRTSFNVGESIHHNIRCLVSDIFDQFQFVVEGEVTDPVFDYVPLLTGRMIDKSYETVRSSMNSGLIAVDTVLKYFSATPPAEVFEKLLVSPLKEMTPESGVLPQKFELEEELLDELISKEKQALLTKLKTIRTKMQEAALDNLVVGFSEEITSQDEVMKALYGDYLCSDDD